MRNAHPKRTAQMAWKGASLSIGRQMYRWRIQIITAPVVPLLERTGPDSAGGVLAGSRTGVAILVHTRLLLELHSVECKVLPLHGRAGVLLSAHGPHNKSGLTQQEKGYFITYLYMTKLYEIRKRRTSNLCQLLMH